MPIIEVNKDFAFAEQGIYVTEYAAGQVVDVSDECAECAIREKWAKTSKKTPAVADEKAADEQAAALAAPENTAAAIAPEIK